MLPVRIMDFHDSNLQTFPCVVIGVLPTGDDIDLAVGSDDNSGFSDGPISEKLKHLDISRFGDKRGLLPPRRWSVIPGYGRWRKRDRYDEAACSNDRTQHARMLGECETQRQQVNYSRATPSCRKLFCRTVVKSEKGPLFGHPPSRITASVA